MESFFRGNPVVGLGFSGGVDSSYLLYAGINHGAKVSAYFVKTAFQPEFELADAQRLAGKLGVVLKVIRMDILSDPRVAANPEDRCYHCKKAIFGELSRQAAADGVPLLIDGSNASDDAGTRPGMRALAELGVRSPLRECGLSKADVRRLSREAGLFTWDKPAYACLATRIPTGCGITAETLRRIECSEDALFAMGFSDFRVRVFSDAARLQFTAAQAGEAFARRAEVVSALKPYFSAVLLDLEGRG